MKQLNLSLIKAFLYLMFIAVFTFNGNVFSQSQCISCTSSDPVNQSLMLCYPFNGNANDESGHNNDGTVNGATLTSDRFGKANSAYNFDGTNDEITFDPDSLLLDSYTYSIWINVKANPSSGNIYSYLTIGGNITDQFLALSNNASAGSGIFSTGLGYSSYFASGSTPNRYWDSILPDTNMWYHIVLTRSSSTLKFYVNGSLKDSRSTSAPSPSYLGTLNGVVGSRGGLQYFKGKLDDIRIYKRVLSLSEIENLYEATVCCSECTKNDPINSSLLLCYPFNGNANDESGHNNDGTVNGATLTSDRFGKANSAYNFDGTNDEITFDPDSLLLDSYTYSIWINVKANPSSGNIYSYLTIGGNITDQFLALSNNASAGSGIFSTGLGYSSYFASGSTPNRYWDSILPDTNMWYHIVLTRSSSTLKFYVNGSLKDSRPTSAPSPSYLGTLNGVVGSRGGLQYFKGKLDDIRIYKRILSLSEIENLYDCGGFDEMLFLTGEEKFSEIENDLAVYPNPAHDIVSIKSKNVGIKNVKIINMLGETMYNEDYSGSEYFVNTGSYMRGFYFIIISDDKGRVHSQKIILD
jgi:hypothetical protein